MRSAPWGSAAAAPVLVAVLAVVPALYCLVDITRHPDTRVFPARTWMVLCAFLGICGVFLYLTRGRSPHR